MSEKADDNIIPLGKPVDAVERDERPRELEGFFYDGEHSYFSTRPLPLKYITVNEKDWRRLERMLPELDPPSFVAGLLLATSVGLLTSAIFTLIGFYAAGNISEKWLVVGWSVLVVSILLTILFGVIVRFQSKRFHTSLRTFQREMAEIWTAEKPD